MFAFTPKQLKSFRVHAVQAIVRHSLGQNATVAMPAHPQASKTVVRQHRQVTMAWATMQASLRVAAQRLERLKRPWTCATDSADTFILTLARLVGAPDQRVSFVAR